jgi:RecB family exonuclease
MRFSASRLRAWMECQLAAKYRYEDNLPRKANAKMVFGTVIHACLQHYYESRGNWDEADKMFRRIWSDPAKAGYPIDYWPKHTSFGSLMGKGRDILRAVHDGHRWQDFTVLGTEIPFLVPIGEHELTGYIDLLGIERSGTGKELLKIIDFKTASKPPTFAQLALDVQFTSYAYAVSQHEFWVGVDGDAKFAGIDNGEWLWQTVSTMKRRCIWWGLWSAKQIDAGPRTEKDFQRLYRVMTEIEKSINAGVAVPKIGEACDWCDYQEPCALEIPVAIAQVTDRSDPNRWV